MNSHAKWLREAARLAERAGLHNIANTCTQGAAEIERLEAALKAKGPAPNEASPFIPGAREVSGVDSGIVPECKGQSG